MDPVTENEIEPDNADAKDVSPDSVRADVEAAFAEVEKAEPKEASPAEEKTDQTDKVSTEVAEKAQPQAKGTEKPVATDSKPIHPPSDWSADKQALWTTLPREMQEYLTSRQSEVQKFANSKSQEAARSIRERDAFYQAVSPRSEILRAAGVHPAEYVKSLVRAEQMMDENPKDALLRLAAHYQVDLAELATLSAQPIHPDVAAVRNDLTSVRRELAEERARLVMQHNEAQRAQVVSVVEDFKAAQDESGKPLFPYVSDPTFEQAMSAELKLLRHQNPETPPEDMLVRAYDATVWKLPHTRAAELEKQKRIMEARTTSAAKQRSEAARSRDVSITGAPGASAVKITSDGSVRGDILASMESLGL